MCVCYAAAGAFFPGKMTFLGFLCHVCVCYAAAGAFFFFRKNDVPGIFETCNSPVEVFLRAAGAFFLANSDSQMALAIFVV